MIDKVAPFWNFSAFRNNQVIWQIRGRNCLCDVWKCTWQVMNFSISVNELCLVNSPAHQQSRAQIICLSYLIQFVYCIFHSVFPKSNFRKDKCIVTYSTELDLLITKTKKMDSNLGRNKNYSLSVLCTSEYYLVSSKG
jgi:hypothetical protein